MSTLGLAFVVHIADSGLSITTHVRSQVELGPEILECVARHAFVIDEQVLERT